MQQSSWIPLPRAAFWVLSCGLLVGAACRSTAQDPAATKADAKDSPAPSGQAARLAPANVEIAGAWHEIIHRSDTRTRITFEQVRAKQNHLFGIGQLAEFGGTATIWDGELWQTTASDDGKPVTNHGSDLHANLMLLASTNASTWTTLRASEALDEAALTKLLTDYAQSQSLPEEQPLMFTWEGTISQAKWHVLHAGTSELVQETPEQHAGHRHGQHTYLEHLEAALHGEIGEKSVKFVGFFSRKHRGIITSKGSLVAVHVIDTTDKLTAIVDTFVLPADSSIKIAVGE